MKKILQAAGLASASAAILSVPTLAEGAGKWYTLTAGIRGFYDDNIYTAPKNSGRKFASPGVDITPGIALNFPFEQTKINLGYTFGLRYFADRDPNGARNRDYDMYHNFDVDVSHVFSPRYKTSFYDHFSVTQEPEQFINSVLFLGRAEGNNVRNLAGVDFDAQLSELWSTTLSYQNAYFDFADVNYAQLNRMEHTPGVRFNYQLSPTTVLGFGYNYEVNDYRAPVAPVLVDRDVTTHRVFGSADHSFTGTIQGSVRAGVEISNWDAPGVKDETNPYVDASLSWTYNPGSYVQGGVRHGRQATDAFLFGGNDILDSESTSVYAAVSHAFTARIRGTLTARYQIGDLKYSGVATSIETDKYLMLGAVASYKFNQYISGEVAYYFDDARTDHKLVLGNGRSFERNRIFFGVRLTY